MAFVKLTPEQHAERVETARAQVAQVRETLGVAGLAALETYLREHIEIGYTDPIRVLFLRPSKAESKAKKAAKVAATAEPVKAPKARSGKVKVIRPEAEAEKAA